MDREANILSYSSSFSSMELLWGASIGSALSSSAVYGYRKRNVNFHLRAAWHHALFCLLSSYPFTVPSAYLQTDVYFLGSFALQMLVWGSLFKLSHWPAFRTVTDSSEQTQWFTFVSLCVWVFFFKLLFFLYAVGIYKHGFSILFIIIILKLHYGQLAVS